MTWRIALTVSIVHDYWGEEPAPVKLASADPSALARGGMMLRPAPGGGAVIAEVGETTPDAILLDIIATDDLLLPLTESAAGGGAPVPMIDLTGGTADADFAFSGSWTGETVPRGVADRRLARLAVALPQDGTRVVRIACRAVDALWTYHFVGTSIDGPIRIVDGDARIAFEDLGRQTLPGGRQARVLRSTAPVPLRARPVVRLALEEARPAPYDAMTLIPVLPAAGPSLRPVAEPGAAAPLQSDIYVSLW
jgi:hypothetical protein